MLTKPKQIVIDKSAFCGTSTDGLRTFVREDGWLILPEVLVYECATDDHDPESKLLCRFRDVMFAGAYTCPGCLDMMHWEAHDLKPYPSLTDFGETYAIRRRFSRARGIRPSTHIRKIYDGVLQSARAFCEFTRSIAASMHTSIPDAVKAACRDLRDREDRLRLWVSAADRVDLHRLAVEKSPRDFAASPDRFCLSSDWVSWQYWRLVSILSYEAIFLAEGGGPINELRAEHDLNDIEYVLLLSRADGIITRDKKLVEPLARAAFPEKDVFSSLEEVPETYRCDWI
jgi:hypothetical protein